LLIHNCLPQLSSAYNAVPEVTAKNAKLVSYANDTSHIVTSSSPTEFATKLNNFLAEVQE